MSAFYCMSLDNVRPPPLNALTSRKSTSKTHLWFLVSVSPPDKTCFSDGHGPCPAPFSAIPLKNHRSVFMGSTPALLPHPFLVSCYWILARRVCFASCFHVSNLRGDSVSGKHPCTKLSDAQRSLRHSFHRFGSLLSAVPVGPRHFGPAASGHAPCCMPKGTLA